MEVTSQQLVNFIQKTSLLIPAVIKINPRYIDTEPFVDVILAGIRITETVFSKDSDSTINNLFEKTNNDLSIRKNVSVGQLAEIAQQTGNFLVLAIQKTSNIIQTEEFQNYVAAGLTFGLIVLQDNTLSLRNSEIFQEFHQASQPILQFLQQQ